MFYQLNDSISSSEVKKHTIANLSKTHAESYNQLITWKERQTSKGKVRTWRNFKLVRLTTTFCFSEDSVVVGEEFNDLVEKI